MSQSISNAITMWVVHVVIWHVFAAIFALLDFTGERDLLPGKLFWQSKMMR
jgi:hypothetical protein